ncbi:hypothetical protein C8J56DRAFT_939942 [Mycena floridula]|nr:hypothetical protein C8J56DRAFT_939942 [Mycena floridula]
MSHRIQSISSSSSSSSSTESILEGAESQTSSSDLSFYGLGSVTSKAVYHIGKGAVRYAERIIVNSRRERIRQLVPMTACEAQLLGEKAAGKLYDDLLELSRPHLYKPNIQAEAMILILDQIHLGEFECLAEAVGRWHEVEVELLFLQIFDDISRKISEKSDVKLLRLTRVLLFVSRIMVINQEMCKAVLSAGLPTILATIEEDLSIFNPTTNTDNIPDRQLRWKTQLHISYHLIHSVVDKVYPQFEVLRVLRGASCHSYPIFDTTTYKTPLAARGAFLDDPAVLHLMQDLLDVSEKQKIMIRWFSPTGMVTHQECGSLLFDTPLESMPHLPVHAINSLLIRTINQLLNTVGSQLPLIVLSYVLAYFALIDTSSESGCSLVEFNPETGIYSRLPFIKLLLGSEGLNPRKRLLFRDLNNLRFILHDLTARLNRH